MTKNIVFTGPEDIRIFGAEDLKTHSAIDGFRKTAFYKGKPTEVEDDVFVALTTQGDIYGNFEEFVLGEPVTETKSAKALEDEADADPLVARATSADAVNATPTKTKVSGSTSTSK